MRPPLRIAVLECDTPIDPVKAQYGTYGDVFKLLLQSSAATLGSLNSDDLIITKWDIVDGTEYPDLDEVDAILLTGSSALSSCFQEMALKKCAQADTAV
jgi:hypothetical protein